MASFEFKFNREEMRETEKAYGFGYSVRDKNHAGRWVTRWQWLPKSQITVEDIEFDGEDVWWHEGDVIVTVPGWLAYKERYFKNTILREMRVY